MRWARLGAAVGVAVGMAAAWPQEGRATDTFVRYEGPISELGVTFEYPEGWEAEKSVGSTEAYAQVQIYAPASVEPRMRSYLVVRAVPPKARGGRYADVREMIADYRQTLQPGLRAEGESPAEVSGWPATRLEVDGELLLPWNSQQAKPVPVKGQRVFLEQGGRMYELAWLSTPEATAQVRRAFERLLETFSITVGHDQKGGS